MSKWKADYKSCVAMMEFVFKMVRSIVEKKKRVENADYQLFLLFPSMVLKDLRVIKVLLS